MKKHKEPQFLNDRPHLQRAFTRIYANEIKSMVDKYESMNFESEEQWEERKRLAPSAMDFLNSG